MDTFKFFHATNITIHVVAGTVALLLGIVALSSKKGRQIHTKSGKWFLGFLTIVIFTGLLGVFMFGRNTFLLVITLLSAYQGFSGYRALQTKNNKPKLIDILTAITTLLSALYFMYYIRQIGFFWKPVVIYSTLGALFTVITYDFLRYFIPVSRYGRLWLYEHIYKMIGAFTALLAAFMGTVFATYQPYSQILPSALGVVLQIVFLIYYFKKNSISNE
jgi:uncharacterized membrane protein